MAAVSGFTRDSGGNLVARTLRFYRRDTGVLLGAASSSGGSDGDPHFGNVSLLLHMDGIQGSTTFADSSPLTKAVTAHGGAIVSTAQSQFGGASLLLDGAGSYLSSPEHTDYVFGTGDFSIEAWIRTTTTSEKTIVDNYSSVQPSWQLAVKNGKLSFYSRSASGAAYVLAGSIPVNDGQFHFASVTRQDGVLRFFVDGTPDGEAPLTTNYNTAITLGIGAQVAVRNTSYDFPGNIDDLRITKGVARPNTAVPSQAFPDMQTGDVFGQYYFQTPYTGEVQVICLDDDGAPLENDQVLRTFPV